MDIMKTNKIKVLMAAGVILGLGACQATNPVEQVKTTNSSSYGFKYFYNYGLPASSMDSPSLNNLSVANTGDTILRKQISNDWLSEDIKFAKNIPMNEFSFNDVYGIKYKKIDGEGLVACMTAKFRDVCLIDKDFNGTVDKDFNGVLDSGYKLDEYRGTFDAFYKPVDEAMAIKSFKQLPYTLTYSKKQPLGIQKTIVFQGLSKGEIKITYKEFTKDGLARPSFDQTVTFDADKLPTMIGIKGAKIKVEAVDGLEIKYKVIKSFS